jgi:predicted TIM-barrel fold metal-dependent hydrolase
MALPPIEHNVTGIDFADRRHLVYAGPPLIDVHAHITRTRPPGADTPWDIGAARTMMAVAAEFGVRRIYTMCPPEDVAPLRQELGARLGVIASISKKLDEPDDVAYRLLDRFLEQGAELLKFWAAPRGRDRGLFVDAPWRIEAARRARSAGVRVVMVHVADPDAWFDTVYADDAKFGTKAEQYAPFRRMLEMFPDLTWIGAHMGGAPERPDFLDELLTTYPHLYLDTSATKWQVREVSAHRDALRALIGRHPTRFLFGSDLVTRHDLPPDHYRSRYWCQRTLWESDWEGPSPIHDPDYRPQDGAPATPLLRGLGLAPDLLARAYHDNVVTLLPGAGP